jgi:hypothetical protein
MAIKQIFVQQILAAGFFPDLSGLVVHVNNFSLTVADGYPRIKFIKPRFVEHCLSSLIKKHFNLLMNLPQFG